MHDAIRFDPNGILLHVGIRGATVTSATGGYDTLIWRVQAGSETYALRVFRPGQEVVSARERMAMEAARQAVPVPPIHAHGVWEDRPFMLMAWCRGETWINALRSQPHRLWHISAAVGAAQARLHTVTAPLNLSPADEWMGWAGDEEMALQTRLRALPQRKALLHLDYHLSNVMVDGVEVSGILDWSNARPGDPRADIARTYTQLQVEPWFSNRQPFWITLFRWAATRAWQQGYHSVAGAFPQADMPLFYSWAGAAMARDLAPRVAKPEHWFAARHLAYIQQWTERQKRLIRG